jgi:DNA-binding transcriptional regulator GbsR (MarR family)
MTLSPLTEQLVLHWGAMASRWGIGRTVAQIHALLYFTAKPLPAEEIVQALGVARSHVSNSLRELQSWGVAKTVHILGDRREHFQSIGDVWQLFEVLLDERKRREVDPTLKELRSVSAQFARSATENPDAVARLKEMLDFFEMMDAWFGEVRRLPLEKRVKLVKLAGRIQKWLG